MRDEGICHHLHHSTEMELPSVMAPRPVMTYGQFVEGEYRIFFFFFPLHCKQKSHFQFVWTRNKIGGYFCSIRSPRWLFVTAALVAFIFFLHSILYCFLLHRQMPSFLLTLGHIWRIKSLLHGQVDQWLPPSPRRDGPGCLLTFTWETSPLLLAAWRKERNTCDQPRRPWSRGRGQDSGWHQAKPLMCASTLCGLFLVL